MHFVEKLWINISSSQCNLKFISDPELPGFGSEMIFPGPDPDSALKCNVIEHNRYIHVARGCGSNTLQMKLWESNMNDWFPFMYSQQRNCYFKNRIIMLCLPVPTLIYLWEIYIFPWLVCLFCCRKYVDRSWEYINRSHTHECGN